MNKKKIQKYNLDKLLLNGMYGTIIERLEKTIFYVSLDKRIIRVNIEIPDHQRINSVKECMCKIAYSQGYEGMMHNMCDSKDREKCNIYKLLNTITKCE